MTSKSSFSKLVKMNLRSNIWSLALACIGFFFAFPVYGALFVSTVKNRIATGSYMEGVAKALFRRDVLGESNYFVSVGIVMIAVIIAFNSFSFLFSKSKTDLLHGVPVKREKLFFAEYVAGIITYIVPYVVFMLLCMIVAGANQVIDGKGIISALLMFVINLLGFLIIYTSTVIAIMVTGNFPVAMIGTFAVMAYVPMIETLKNLYNDEFFKTYSYHSSENSKLVRFSPVSAFFGLNKGMDSYTGIYEINIGYFVCFILACVILTALALYIYKTRPSEAAGKSLAFKKIMPVLSVMILVPAALYFGIGFEMLASLSVKRSYGWFVFGAIIAIVIGHMIIQTIFYQDFKSVLKNPVNLIAAAVITGIISSIYIFDLTGYDKYIPNDDKYVSASVSSYGMQSSIEYFDFDVVPDEFGGYNVWKNADDYRFEHMQITDKNLIRELAMAGYEDTQAEYYSRESEDYNDDVVYSLMTIKYTMASGKEVYREYYIDLLKRIDLYNKLFTAKGYKEGVYSILDLPDDQIKNIEYSGVFGVDKLSLSDEQMKKLVNAYKEDLMKQDAYSLRDEIPYGYIYRKVSIDEYNSLSIYCADKGYIYPSFTKTTELLKSYGAKLDLLSCIDMIDEVTVENYHYNEAEVYEGEPDKAKYTSEDDKKAILSGAYPYEFIDVEGCLHKTENLDITVHLNTDSNMYGQNYAFTFEKGKVPDFVIKDVNYNPESVKTQNNEDVWLLK